MHRLSSSDYRLLLDCAGELHSLRDLPSLRLWLVDAALPSLIPCDWVSYNEVDLKAPHKTVALLRPTPASVMPLLLRFAELSHQHPIIARQINGNDLSVRTISDFLTRVEFHRLDLYHDVYRPMGVEYQMSAALETRRDCITALALSRRRRDFSPRDRSILTHLQRQLFIALRNLLVAEDARRVRQDCAKALDSHSMATITINRRGGIVHHYGSALEWVGTRGGGHLPADVLAWISERRGGVNHLASPDLLLARPHGELVIRAFPSDHPDHTLLTLKLRPAVSSQNQPILNLSPRETEVARWICAGKTNAQIAQILLISPRTVQKHIEHIFDRLGVDSRVALTARVLRAAL
jgi:DNA-binding CsgD family transcriptional regulator